MTIQPTSQDLRDALDAAAMVQFRKRARSAVDIRRLCADECAPLLPDLSALDQLQTPRDPAYPMIQRLLRKKLIERVSTGVYRATDDD